MATILDTSDISDVGRADTAFAEALGRMVRLGRAKRGMSRRQLAQESKTSERYLAQIESGAGNPSVLVFGMMLSSRSPAVIGPTSSASVYSPRM